MSQHRALTILDAIYAKLAAVELPPGEPVTRVRNKVYGLDQVDLPAVALRMGPDTPDHQSRQVHSDLLVYVDLVVNTHQEDLDSDTLALRQQVEELLAADHTLGLPFVVDVEWAGQHDPAFGGNQAELPVGATRLQYRVSYRYPPGQPAG